ncbi:ATP-binding protein [Aminobacter sp. AP02]|uniref:AAA family ATPase n=1 Tax=Aminobacter sp. AP02 TaxID=2135737 RepID=UPI001AECF047|nr:ATP-binding protein [Aminobacter sp. AP02]
MGDIGRRRYLAAQEMRSAGSSGRSAAGGAKRKPSRGPASGAEVIQPTLPSGSMSDRFVPRIESLAGYGEAAAWALSLREDLDLWRGGKLQWGEMSTRILLSGPPGTGKTLFARALCNSLQVPMIASSVAAWLEPGYLGEVLRRMVGTFAEAEAAKPCILFVDELDGIGSRERRGEWDQYWSSVVNRGLELLDGAARSSGVIVVAASNLPQMIDPALLRSGRLETHIVIPPPDIDALAEILRHHLGADLEAIVASAEA